MVTLRECIRTLQRLTHITVLCIALLPLGQSFDIFPMTSASTQANRNATTVGGRVVKLPVGFLTIMSTPPLTVTCILIGQLQRKLGFCTLCFWFCTKMLRINAPCFPLKCSASPQKVTKMLGCSLHRGF